MLTPGLDHGKAEKDRHCRGPSFNHPSWQQLLHAQGPLKAPLNECEWCSCRASGVVSLSRWRKVCLPLALWQESGPNLGAYQR